VLAGSRQVRTTVATDSCIGVHLGPGPRDGLMTGFVRRTGRSVRLVRCAIELAVVAVGFLLGGTVGAITVLYALAIGPLVHLFLPRLSVPPTAPPGPGTTPARGQRGAGMTRPSAP
jgi:uncharacterized membrane protein YczE